jgi:hypothetical protein
VGNINSIDRFTSCILELCTQEDQRYCPRTQEDDYRPLTEVKDTRLETTHGDTDINILGN